MLLGLLLFFSYFTNTTLSNTAFLLSTFNLSLFKCVLHIFAHLLIASEVLKRMQTLTGWGEGGHWWKMPGQVMQLTWRKTFTSWLHSCLFPPAKAKTEQTKSHHHSAHRSNTNDFGRRVDMEKFCLKQTRRKMLLRIKCSCFSPSCSPSCLLNCILCAPMHASNIYMF